MPLRALRIVPKRRVAGFFLELGYPADLAGIVKAAPEAFAGGRSVFADRSEADRSR
jgi:hypothetical protein